MSKTWKQQPYSQRNDSTPQKAIERLRLQEAQEDIREVTRKSEVQRATSVR